jgi:transposase
MKTGVNYKGVSKGFRISSLARKQRALLVREFLANHNMLSLPCPPYSPDLAPADFFLFPKMKMQLKGRRFHIAAEIQRESQATTHT